MEEAAEAVAVAAATTKEKRKHFTKENAMECYSKKQARGIFKTLSLGKQLARNTFEKEMRSLYMKM